MVKFLSFSTCGGRHYGVLKEDGIVDLSARHGSRWPTLREVIEAGVLAQLAQEAAGLPPMFRFLPSPMRFQFLRRERSSVSVSIFQIETRNTRMGRLRRPIPRSSSGFPAPSPGMSAR